MKKITLVLTAFVYLFFLNFVSAQQGMLTSEEDLIGKSSDFFVGLHTGIFDSNQSIKFPYNIGVVAQYNYIPDVTKRWFFGAEAGAFFTASKEDALNRKTKMILGDITLYPGWSFPIAAKISPDDNAAIRLKKLSLARKARIGLGFTATIPILKKSEGNGVNLNAIKPGFGLTLRSSYELPNKLTVFMNATMVNQDLDGYAYKSNTSSERSNGNKHDASFYLKLGFLWNFKL